MAFFKTYDLMSVPLGAYFERINHSNLYSMFKVLDSNNNFKIKQFTAVFIKQYFKT